MPGVIIFLHTNANFVFPSMLCQLPQQFQFLRSDMSTPQLVQKNIFLCVLATAAIMKPKNVHPTVQ